MCVSDRGPQIEYAKPRQIYWIRVVYDLVECECILKVQALQLIGMMRQHRTELLCRWSREVRSHAHFHLREIPRLDGNPYSVQADLSKDRAHHYRLPGLPGQSKNLPERQRSECRYM